MTRNHMELTHADDLDAEELELISQYVAHEMSAAEEQRFERRLADDERFFDRVMPLLDVWYDTDVWPIEPTVVPMSAPAKRATRVWLGLVGGSGVVATAAGIAFTMVMRSGGVPPVQLPIAADRDAPPQVPPVVAKAPVVAEHTPTLRGSQRTLDSAIQRAVAAAIDTAGLRLVAELDRKGLPEVQFAPPQVTVVAAWPAVAEDGGADPGDGRCVGREQAATGQRRTASERADERRRSGMVASRYRSGEAAPAVQVPGGTTALPGDRSAAAVRKCICIHCHRL